MTLAFATSLSVACERAKAPPRSDSTHGATGVPDSTTVAASSRGKWDDAAGRVLLVAASVPGQAYVVTPDSATAAAQIAALPHPASVTLFGRGGTVQTADLSAVSDTTTCAVGVLHAAPPPRPWSVGFVGGVVAPLALDSTEAIGTSDSSALVVAITRLASALPNDTAGRFAGLPFVVRSLWRFTIPNGTVVVVASINRQINQEATPLQEHTLIIGERATNDTAFTMAYSERSYGEEETIESRDVLSGVLIGGNRVASLFVVRDYGDATAYSLIERGDDGRWRRRWTSARRHC
ncbi:MAG: hypothetical protein ACREPM_01265 [Gemmatimonadaceae bacterium]